MIGVFEKKDKSRIIQNVLKNVENVNAKQFLIDDRIEIIKAVLSEFIRAKDGYITPEYAKVIQNKAKIEAEAILSNIEKQSLPIELEKILDTELKKKQQIALLKGATITPSQLGALFLKAGEKGYMYSQYRFEKEQKKYPKQDLPTFAQIRDDGTIEYEGETTLTDGQIKDLITTTKFIVARILDNGKHWHCFFQNSSGIQGKEGGVLGSQSHLHYISDSFGISKKELIEQIKNVEYPTTPVHILLKGYRP